MTKINMFLTYMNISKCSLKHLIIIWKKASGKLLCISLLEVSLIYVKINKMINGRVHYQLEKNIPDIDMR